MYELEGVEHVSFRVAPLDVGVLSECILQDCRHGFERVDAEGERRGCGYRLYCG